MAANSNKWQASKINRLAAGAVAALATTFTIVAIHLLSVYYATGPILVSAAQLAA